MCQAFSDVHDGNNNWFDSTECDYAHTIGICDPRMDGRIDSGSVELLCESSVHGYGVMDIGGRLD